MAADPMLDDLDRQFMEFVVGLQDAYRDARKGASQAPLATAGPVRYLLSHVSWNDGEAINLGIMIQGWIQDGASNE